jgi:hypothetical protein
MLYRIKNTCGQLKGHLNPMNLVLRIFLGYYFQSFSDEILGKSLARGRTVDLYYSNQLIGRNPGLRIFGGLYSLGEGELFWSPFISPYDG